MKASKFTEAQQAFILKWGEAGTPIAQICPRAGISQATYFYWKKRYGGLRPDEMRRLKALEESPRTAASSWVGASIPPDCVRVHPDIQQQALA